MKNYLKMADVFNECEVVETDVKVLFAVTEEYDDCVTPHEYAHHAIECHDELVQINQELLEALEDAATSLETIQLRSFGEDSFLDSKPEMRSYAGSRASVVRSAIAKAKGGAA